MDTTYAVGKHKRFVFGSTVLPRASSSCHLDPPTCQIHAPQAWLESGRNVKKNISISGLVVEYIVAIDVTRVRFPADAYHACPFLPFATAGVFGSSRGPALSR